MQAPQSPYPLKFETRRLQLREFEETDAEAARALDSDPQVVRFMVYDVLDDAGTQAAMRKSIERAQATPRTVYELAVTLKPDTHVYVGKVGLCIRRPEHREADVWFQLRQDLWGRGYVTEAMQPLLRYGFETLHLHRIYGDCDPRNAGSAAVMRKLGMTLEGHLRQNWWLKGEWCDSHIYGLLEDEWRARSRP
jgi:[ribosomal protein S5]-alanine N-acetyltransferase